MIYVAMIIGVLIYAALGLVCWALCWAKTLHEREQKRSERDGKAD